MSVDPRLIPPSAPDPSPFLDYSGETEGGVGVNLLGTTLRIPLQHMIEWELDWDTYRTEFSRAHGDSPVQIDQWLVWEDGWRCDAYDPGGTEQPPPDDPVQLTRLKTAYYEKRREWVQAHFNNFRSRIEAIKSIQAHKSLPLHMRSLSWSRSVGDDGLEVYTPTVVQDALDLGPMERVMEDLRREVAYCDNKLKEIGNG